MDPIILATITKALIGKRVESMSITPFDPELALPALLRISLDDGTVLDMPVSAMTITSPRGVIKFGAEATHSLGMTLHIPDPSRTSLQE